MKEFEFDLQLFAEEPDSADTPDTPEDDEKTPDNGKVTFTPEQQAYIDQMMSERLSREQRRAEKKAKEKAAQEAEAERLKNLSDTERNAQRMADLEKQLAVLQAEKQETAMLTAARAELQSRGYTFSDAIVSHLIADSAEATKESIDSFIKEFDKAVTAKVKESVKPTVPKAGTGKTITKAEIMSVKNKAERQKLINENIHLFKK